MINLEVKNFIDYFVLCGLDVKSGLESEHSENSDETPNSKPPLEGSYKSKILYHFPENLPWNPFDEDAVTQLCLPKGLVFQRHSSKPKFHPYIITREDGSRVFGGTLTFFELIEDESICNAMQALQTMYDAEHSSSANRSLSSVSTSSSRSHFRSASSANVELTNRSNQSRTQSITTPISLNKNYSYSSRSNSQNENEYNENESNLIETEKFTNLKSESPESLSSYDSVLKSSNGSYNKNRRSLTQKLNSLNLSSPTKVSHYNILKDRLYASKCICIVSQYPFNRSFQKILQTLFDMVEKTDLLGINLESHLYNLIYELPMPLHGQIMKFQVGCKPINVYMPDASREFPLLDYDLLEFFRLLGVTNIVNLYITGLLEHQILLYSKDYFLLMLVAESLTSLFFPFTWLKPYVPIVPASNLHFIEAPVPYIMGFHHKDIDKEFFKQGQRCFVDIDSGTVTCPEGLPEFPDKNKLIKEINDLIVYFNEKKLKSKRNMSSLNSDILNSSQAYVRISELALRTGAILSSNDEIGEIDTPIVNFDSDEVISMQFGRCVRELFLSKFVQMFASYEKFVIVPTIENNDFENWWMNREYSGNFDSKMFLIEQPSPRLPFLSHFISTQMFVSFIDLKIISIIDPQKPIDFNVKMFDEKIKQFKEGDLNLYEVKNENSKGFIDVKELEKEVLVKLNQEPVVAPSVLSIRTNETKTCESNFMAKFTLTTTEQFTDKKDHIYLFENIDKNCLKADETFIKQIHSEMLQKKELLQKSREQFKNSQLKLSLDKPSKAIKEKRRSKPKDPNSSPSTNNTDLTDSKQQELNPIFIQSLLKESKLKTKRMLVEKIPEAATLGHGEARISGIEENMLIASLCDLIERIWGHGLHNKGGKSALWNHLSNYRKLIQYLHPSSHLILDPRNVSPRSSTLPRKRVNTSLTPDASIQKTSPYLSLTRPHNNSTNNLTTYPNGISNHKRTNSANGEITIKFPPIKNDLLADLARIDKLTEVKTEIGMARAFVRLSLEKKLLADHLRQLLSEAELLRALYKKHAFLRQEEEREQFIYHLESLKVVDYFSFTNHFKSMPTDYSVLIIPSRKFNSSTTSANPYMKLYGSLGESDIALIPKNSLEFIISCKHNLGPLTSLVIGHDNAGMTPKWMIDFLFVRNEITGHINRFPCGRWLGKGVDDDSLERLLIAETVDFSEAYDLTNVRLQSPYGTISRSRSPTVVRSEEKKLPSSTIQEMVGNTINTLVKYFEKPETERGHLTSLMCGENGLVSCLEHIFTFGFKSYKLFKKLYVWDFLEKTAYEIETLLNYPNIKSSNQLTKTSKNFYYEKYICAIKAINSTSVNYGKDGKFQIFICLACRDSFLTDWFMILSKSNTATQMYDEFSFLRNHDLNKFCFKILSLTDQFNFKLENSLTMGITY
ncbi:unnamed protein product [Brachionus calyciflorus]|uniref:Uncharacterized protein n=1 Tax=Brachionus calyciflorus TaxID=104777 RepID=A0A813NAG4_9BILA|nr:unnamed protein product [Brachionus calyciflorus]